MFSDSGAMWKNVVHNEIQKGKKVAQKIGTGTGAKNWAEKRDKLQISKRLDDWRKKIQQSYSTSGCRHGTNMNRHRDPPFSQPINFWSANGNIFQSSSFLFSNQG